MPSFGLLPLLFRALLLLNMCCCLTWTGCCNGQQILAGGNTNNSNLGLTYTANMTASMLPLSNIAFAAYVATPATPQLQQLTPTALTTGTTVRPTMAPPTTTTTTDSSSTKRTSSLRVKDATSPTVLRLGFLMANGTPAMRMYYGFGQSAPAAQLAIAQAIEDGLLDGINVSFAYNWYITDCSHALGTGGTNELVLNHHVDIIFTPPCTLAAITSAAISEFYNVPMMAWGAAAYTPFAYYSQYPTVTTATVNTYQTSLAVLSVLLQYKWNEVGMILWPDNVQGTCAPGMFPTDFQNVILAANITITFSQQLDGTKAGAKTALKRLANYSRIVVTCIDDQNDRRNFLLWVNEMGMIGADWVYVYASMVGQGMQSMSTLSGEYVPMWQNRNVNGDDGQNAKALNAARSFIVVDVQQQNESIISAFNKQVLALQGSYPFFCADACLGNMTTDKFASVFAWNLYNAVYIYLNIVNKTIAGGGSWDDMRNGTFFDANGQGNYAGINGAVAIDTNGTLVPTYSAWALNSANEPTVYITVTITNMYTNEYALYLNYSNAAKTIWASRNGMQPLYMPACGYQGNQCAKNLTLDIIAAGGVLVVVVVFAIVAIGYTIRQRNLERERINSETLVPWAELRKLTQTDQKRDDTGSIANKSHSSLSSSLTEGSAASGTVKAKLIGAHIHLETDNHCFFVREQEGVGDGVLDKQLVFGRKYAMRVKLIQDDVKLLRQIRQLDHDNLNKFVGICVDGGPTCFALWKVCQRGSIKNAIETQNKYINDPYILATLIRDIVNGLGVIHQSFLRAHGMLTSECCLISDRWEVKISDYGIDLFRLHQSTLKRKLLWTAPELLRSGDLRGTRAGDIYSFAIICSELINFQVVWGGVDDEKQIEDTLRSVQNSSRTLSFRPTLAHRDELKPIMYQLVRDCWADRAEDRLEINQIQRTMKEVLKNREQNLIDYVLNMMEQYTTSLEQEVDERTKELVEEKKKSDVLLYRMLPRQVVDKLKAGESVEPEHF